MCEQNLNGGNVRRVQNNDGKTTGRFTKGANVENAPDPREIMKKIEKQKEESNKSKRSE